MNKPLVAVMIASFLNVAAYVQAAPRLQYNHLTGNIWVHNDVPSSIINIKSPLGLLHAPTFPNGAISGAVFDTGDLPNFIAVLNTPVGSYKLGDGTASPGIPGITIDFGVYVPPPEYLAFDWYGSFGHPPFPHRGYWIPEPSSGLLIASSLLGFLAARRRHSVG